MCRIVDPTKVFKYCHGYKVDHHLFLFSPGCIGFLSKDQIPECKVIRLDNAPPWHNTFHSWKEALEAPVVDTSHMRQVIAIQHCGHLVHLAKEEGILDKIHGNVPAFMSYCEHLYGLGHKKEYWEEIPDDVKKWIKEHIDGNLKNLINQAKE